MENAMVKRIVRFYLPSVFFLLVCGYVVNRFMGNSQDKMAMLYVVLGGVIGLALLVNIFLNHRVLNKILGSIAFLASLAMLVFWFVRLLRQSVDSMFRYFLLIIFSIVMAIFLMNYNKADEKKAKKAKKTKN
ncbi:MAG: hypothetical protein ACTTKO_06430 [Candidatus Limimorpha sp.]